MIFVGSKCPQKCLISLHKRTHWLRNGSALWWNRWGRSRWSDGSSASWPPRSVSCRSRGAASRSGPSQSRPPPSRTARADTHYPRIGSPASAAASTWTLTPPRRLWPALPRVYRRRRWSWRSPRPLLPYPSRGLLRHPKGIEGGGGWLRRLRACPVRSRFFRRYRTGCLTGRGSRRRSVCLTPCSFCTATTVLLI